MVAQNSLRDMRIAQLVQTWLNVVAPHADYQHNCEAAKVGLEYGNELVSFPCPKCGAVYCDPVEHDMKLQAQHGCIVCEKKRSKYPLEQGNPLAVLGCQLRDSTFFVQKLPVDSSTLGVTDHYSSCC